MKLISIIKKNFKLLVRSKASAFTVLIGPLLIILLVSLVFSGKTSYELSLGYYTPSHNNLTDSFIDSLKQGNYYVQEFKDEQSCVKKIEQSIIHTCIVFPKDFQINNKQSNELRFLVDYSRMNLVYKIIDSVSGLLEIESKELSYSLTRILLSKINTTLKDIDSELLLLEDINPQINLLMLDIQKAKTNAEAMKLDMTDISLSSMHGRVSLLNETVSEVRAKNLELINETREYLGTLIEIDNYDHWDENKSEEVMQEFDDLENETLNLYNATFEEIQSMTESIEGISSSLSKLESDLNVSKRLNQDTKQKLTSARNNLASMQSGLIDLKDALDKTRQNLKDISITRAESIVSPVNTRIEPIVSETSKQIFMFPFLMVLVIMFVALFLSSTLIMFEKNSKAFFRNFITPTHPSFFVVTTFITSFIVIVLQTLIILGLANYFLQIPLFKNALATLLIIFVTATFFIMLGMAIGYLFSTQEGAMMASIVLGSVFMFLSNLVIPLESIAPALSGIIKYNPYVLASELLRKSLLFKITAGEIWGVILILFGASLILFLAMLALHSLFRRRRIRELREPEDVLKTRLEKQKPLASKPESKPGARPTNKLELLKFVSEMTKAEFEEQVSQKQNKIADFAEKKLGDKKLAHRLRKTASKKEIIRILIEDIRKSRKKAKSEET